MFIPRLITRREYSYRTTPFIETVHTDRINVFYNDPLLGISVI